MSYDEDEDVVVGGISDEEETEDEAFEDDSPLDETYLDDEEIEDGVPEGFLNSDDE